MFGRAWVLVLGLSACNGSIRSSIDSLGADGSTPNPPDNPITDAGMEPMVDAGGELEDSGPIDAGRIDAGPPPDTIGGDRPVAPYVPASYDGAPTPLLVILHGYGGTGSDFQGYVRAHQLSDAEGMLVLYPDGSPADSDGNLAWDTSGSRIDDFAYLMGLLDEMELYYNVSDIYVYGLSSGAHMAYRIACDAADRVSGVIALAGWTWLNESRCSPSEPVPILHVHGTEDWAINYAGEQGSYPAVEEVIRRWVARNGCNHGSAAHLANIDVDLNVSGTETEVTEYTDACTQGRSVALWRVVGGSHVPEASPTFNPAAWAWISQYTR